MMRENRLFRDAVTTKATVVAYNGHQSPGNRGVSFSMVVEIAKPDGTLARLEEQSSSSSQNYPVGQELVITYCREQPDLFVVKGDHSRQYTFIGMIVGGALMTLLGVYLKVR